MFLHRYTFICFYVCINVRSVESTVTGGTRCKQKPNILVHVGQSFVSQTKSPTAIRISHLPRDSFKLSLNSQMNQYNDRDSGKFNANQGTLIIL